MKKSRRNILNKKIDTLLSKKLRKESPQCLHCGNYDTLASCHIYPKGSYPHLRHDEDNLIILCYRHHFHFAHKHPVGFTQWLHECFPERMERLKKKAQEVRKVPLVDLEELYEKLKG